jgi:hypothetical protein
LLALARPTSTHVRMYGLAVKEYIFHNMNRPLTQPTMTHDPSLESIHIIASSIMPGP